MKSRHLLLIAIALTISACSALKPGDSKIGVEISGVNYSDQPITYVVLDPNAPGSVGGEPVDPFGGGGIMCCFRLPEKWQPGIKVRVQIFDTNRKPVKDETVDLPPYVDGKPGRIWAVHYQGGAVDVLSSNYGPPHEKWPGKVKGWPVPTVEYRRKVWEENFALKKLDVRDAEFLIRELHEHPQKNLSDSWKFDQKHRSKEIEAFSGADDPAYKEFLLKTYKESLKAAQQDLEDWIKRQP